MRILLVEDDEFKSDRLKIFLEDTYPNSEITLARSVNTARRAIKSDKFDVIVLDMSLPTFDVSPGESGGRPQGFGGREVLRDMKRSGLSTPVIIVTQYEAFDSQGQKMDLPSLARILESEYPDTFRQVVYYNAATDEWKQKLNLALTSIDK